MQETARDLLFTPSVGTGDESPGGVCKATGVIPAGGSCAGTCKTHPLSSSGMENLLCGNGLMRLGIQHWLLPAAF